MHNVSLGIQIFYFIGADILVQSYNFFQCLFLAVVSKSFWNEQVLTRLFVSKYGLSNGELKFGLINLPR